MKKFFSSVLMAVALLVSANMQAANVAKIVETGTEYATISAAFEAAVDGQTVQLLADVEMNGAVFIKTPARNLTFDMNGKEWNLCGDETCQTQGFILEAGQLTVKGNGSMVYNPIDGIGSALWFKTYTGTKLTLGEVTVVNIGSQPVVECHGELVIDGGTYNNYFFITDDATKVTMNGGTINQQLSLPDGGTVEFVMNGGTLKHLGDGGHGTNNTVVINGGEITDWLSCAGTNTINGGIISKVMGGTNNIYGGTIGQLYYHDENSTAETQYRAGEYKIYGGNYGSINYVTDGSEERKISEDFKKVINFIAKNTTTNVMYSGLNSAFAEAKDGETIQLLQDVEMNGAIFIKAPARNITFDMNEKEWNLCGDETCQTQGFILEAGQLTVKGNGSMVYNPIDGVGSALWFKTYAGTKLTLGDVTVTNIGSQPVVECHGELVIDGGEYNNSFFIAEDATKVTMNGGTINSQLGLPDNGAVEFVMEGGTLKHLGDLGHGTNNTVVINGGEITDWLSCAGTNTINGGTISKIMGGTNVITDGEIGTIYYHTNDGDLQQHEVVYREGTVSIQGGNYKDLNLVTDTEAETLSIEILMPADKKPASSTDPNYPYTLGANSDYFTRDLAEGLWGTVCYTKNITRATGATLYRFVARNTAKTKVMVEEVKAEKIEANKPYLFNATAAEQMFAYGANDVTTLVANNGLIGSLTGIASTTEATWVLNGTSIVPAAVGSTVPAGRAYVDVNSITEDDTVFEEQATAPKRGRLIFSVANTTTDLQSATCNLQPATSKVIVNGQFVIVKDGKMFNAQGQEL